MALGIRCEQSSHWPMHSRSNPVIDHSNYESPCTPPINQQSLDTNMTDRRRTLIYLVAANFMLYFGFRIWQTTINNFAVEDHGIGTASCMRKWLISGGQELFDWLNWS